jgi:hypothetical protein
MQNVGLVVAFRLADRVCGDGKVPGSSEFGAQLLAEAAASCRPPSPATGISRRKSPTPSPTPASRAPTTWPKPWPWATASPSCAC